MIVYDYSELLGLMKKQKKTQKKLAPAIGIGETSLNRSLCNKRDFRQNEIFAMCDALGIPLSNVEKYFFTRRL